MTPTSSKPEFTGRGRARLERARSHGYLNAMGPPHPALARAYGFWCWKLRVPMVWFERRSRRSQFGSVHLEMFTTPNTLNERGESELQRVPAGGSATVTPHAGCWEGIPLKSLEEVARAVFRCATRTGNYRLQEPAPPEAVVHAMQRVRSVLPWRASA